jgi:transposase
VAITGNQHHADGMKATIHPAKKVRSIGISSYRPHAASDLRKEHQDDRSAFAAAEQKIELQAMQIKELVDENAKLRSARWATEEFLQAEICKLKLEIANLGEKLEAANKQLVWLRTNQFGSKSEQGDVVPPVQIAEVKGAGADEQHDGAKSGKRNRGQQPGSNGHGRSDRSEIDTRVQYLDLPGCVCRKCGKPYRLLLRTESSPLTELEISLVRTVFQRCKYVSQCDCEGKKIVVAPPPPKLLPRTEIGNSLWVHLVVRKFLSGMPQNRILKELSLLGLHLPAGTVTGGSKVINDLFDPLVEALINHCRGADLWNADETTWRIFGEGKQRWWLWLIASNDAVVYLLDPSRSKKVPTDFFAGSAGILMTDRLASYKALQESIRKAWCWVHVRRDILNIFKGIKHLSPWSKGWLQDIATLFVLNHIRFELWKQDKISGRDWEQAVLALQLHVQKLKERWEKELKRPKLHKEQSKVLRSMKKHWPGLTIFLEDPRIPLHKDLTSYCTSSVKLCKTTFSKLWYWQRGSAGWWTFGSFQDARKGIGFCGFDDCKRAPALEAS